MSRDTWDEFFKTILVRYVLSYLFETLYLDPSVSLKRIFAYAVGGLFSLSTHALSLPEEYISEVVVAGQCSVFFGAKRLIYKNTEKNKTILPCNFIF